MALHIKTNLYLRDYMPTNPHIRFYEHYQEQLLVEDLIVEAIQFYGQDMVYLPKQFQKLDLIYGEDVISKFDKSFDIEVYIKNVDGFEGDGDFLSKFAGLEIRDQATFTVAQRRFHKLLGNDRIRPNEGDLIYCKFSQSNTSLFEIKYVQPKSVFYQLGELYTYELRVELFEFSHEDINTQIPEIDVIPRQASNTIAIDLDAGTGTFQDQETVFQGTTLAAAVSRAELLFYDVSTNTLHITNVTGSFKKENGTIKGVTSGAQWLMERTNYADNITDPLEDTPQANKEALEYMDFSEQDPFGERED